MTLEQKGSARRGRGRRQRDDAERPRIARAQIGRRAAGLIERRAASGAVSALTKSSSWFVVQHSKASQYCS